MHSGRGAFSIALKIHQALTAGRESAWLYWQLTDGNAVADPTLTDAKTLARSAKYAAVKHFFRHIRPGAVRVNARVSGDERLLASAYVSVVTLQGRGKTVAPSDVERIAPLPAASAHSGKLGGCSCRVAGKSLPAARAGATLIVLIAGLRVRRRCPESAKRR